MTPDPFLVRGLGLGTRPVGHSKLFSGSKMLTFNPAASSLANFNDTISTISMTRLFIYIAVLFKTRTNVCHGITAYTLWRFHGEHQVNTESFRVLFTCRLGCHVHVLPKRRRSFGGVVNFIIKRIFDIKRIFPCSFRNKCMCLLARVYGIGLRPVPRAIYAWRSIYSAHARRKGLVGGA